MLARLGPALAPLLCVPLLLAMIMFAVLVPIGRPSRTLDAHSAVAMTVGVVALAVWAGGLAAQAIWLWRTESGGVVLTPAMSPGLVDVLFSVPFLVVVPVASVGLFSVVRGEGAALAPVVCAVIWAGLCGLREADGAGYVRDGAVTSRNGWLWVRRVSIPVGDVRDVLVVRDSYRGAPSYVVKLDVSEPARCALERRYRAEAEAQTEADRWREALGSLRGAP